jgi:hypothetical protein
VGDVMNLRANIEDKYKQAIKTKNNIEINALRLIKSAIKDKDIASRSGDKNQIISDSEIFSLLQNLIKQRKDSIEAFKIGGRDDLISIEKNEINIISNFLPKQINENETENLIINLIKKNNFNSIRDMGNLMQELKINYAGSIDMSLAGKIAKSKLSS